METSLLQLENSVFQEFFSKKVQNLVDETKSMYSSIHFLLIGQMTLQIKSIILLNEILVSQLLVSLSIFLMMKVLTAVKFYFLSSPIDFSS